MKSLHVNANEIHFPCPNCGQKLACEDGYGGWRIQCPNCQGGVVVPLRSVPRRMATVKLPGAAGPGAASPSQLAAQDNSAQAFIKRVEQLLGCPVDLISVGPSREQAIIVNPIF